MTTQRMNTAVSTTLEEIDWNRVCSADHFTAHRYLPPPSFRPITERLNLLKDLYQGRIGNYTDTGLQPQVFINHFERIVDFNASMLMVEPPTSSDVRSLTNDIHTCLTDRLWAGTAFLHPRIEAATEDSPATKRVDVIDPASRYRTADADYVVTPRHTATNEPVVDVLRIDNQTETLRTHRFSSNQLGDQIGPTTSAASLGRLIPVPRLPLYNDDYGKSMMPRLLPSVVESAIRLTDNSEALSDNAHPLMIWTIQDSFMDEFTALYNLLPDKMTPTDDEIQKAVNDFLPKLRSQSNMRKPDGVEDVAYLTWDASLQASFQQIGLMLNEIRNLSSIPDVLEGGKVTGLRSGSQVKLEMLPSWLFYSTEQWQVRDAFEVALKRIDATLPEWRNPLDVVAEFAEAGEQEPPVQRPQEES